MDTRYNTSSGKCCCAIGCNNSSKKRFLWENEDCLIHVGTIKMFCKCERPFKLFTFPKDSTEVSRQKRLTWISNIKRKNFTPHKYAVVCSDHFIGGKPSDDHPYPELQLGHNLPVISGRPPNKIQKKVPPKRTKDEGVGGVDGVSEFVAVIGDGTAPVPPIEGHDTAFDQRIVFIYSNVSIPTNFCSSVIDKQKQVTHDNNYYSTKKIKTCDAATQTSPSDFLSDTNINFYTGLPNMQIFMAFITILTGVASKTQFKTISVSDQLLLVLTRLRLGLLFQDLADRFFIKKVMAQKLFAFWVPTISEKLSLLLTYIPKTLVQKSMPMNIRLKYPKLRCIIDCTEIFTEKPLQLLARAQMYSHYKSHQTVKYLIGIAPNGLITFLSSGYSGRASDLCVVRKSGFLDLVQRGDQIMVDRGFNIDDDLKSRGAKLIIPDSTRGKTQLSLHEVIHTRRVANT